jgi:hypothetical protein
MTNPENIKVGMPMKPMFLHRTEIWPRETYPAFELIT